MDELRSGQVEREIVRRKTCRTIWSKSAADAVGPIYKGCEIFGISKGQFSLIELIEHCLIATGRADLAISSWTAGAADIVHLHELLENKEIRECWWMVDFSFVARQPEYCDMLIERFGKDSITFTANHAKFVLISNQEWKICIRTSMNLNRNRRAESYEISDCPLLYDFLLGFVRDAFKHGHGWDQCVDAPDAAACTIDSIGGQTEKGPIPIHYGTPKTSKIVYGG